MDLLRRPPSGSVPTLVSLGRCGRIAFDNSICPLANVAKERSRRFASRASLCRLAIRFTMEVLVRSNSFRFTHITVVASEILRR